MTKQYFIELATYNIWATDIVCSWLEKISENQWLQQIRSSFNSIQETSLHIISAENAWCQRINNVENVVWLQKEFKGTKEEQITLWKTISSNLKKVIEDFDELQLQSMLTFKRLNGDEYTMPYYQVFAHVFNHSTFHRGQLVTMLREAGFTEVASTDLLNFYRL